MTWIVDAIVKYSQVQILRFHVATKEAAKSILDEYNEKKQKYREFGNDKEHATIHFPEAGGGQAVLSVVDIAAMSICSEEALEEMLMRDRKLVARIEKAAAE